MASLIDTLRRKPPEPLPTKAVAITAAGDALTSSSIGTVGAGGSASAKQAWQTEVWGYYDAFGELHYGSQFVGSCMSRIVLRLGYLTDSNTVSPVFDEDGQIDPECPADSGQVALAQVVLAAFRDPLGGQGALLEAIGKNLTVTGECHALARDLHNEAGQIVTRRWEVLSTDELRKKKDVRRDGNGRPTEPEFTRYRNGKTAEELPADAFVLRIYRRHPRFSDFADAPTRPLLDIMEVLVLISRQLRSAVMSRLAGAGILWVPSEIDFPIDDTAPEGSEEDDPFSRTLIRQMTNPISDRGAASALVPLVVRADADLIPAITHMRFDSTEDETAIKKMDALIQRFAQGMDLPVEVTTGHQQTTFANAVQVDESTYKAHLEPLAELICGFLTAGYLWPSLGAERPVDAGADDVLLVPTDDKATRLVIYPDAKALVTHADREKHALVALQLKPPLIGPAAGLKALGFENTDGLSPDELDDWIRVQQLIAVKETIRAEETGTGGISLEDPEVQKALDQQNAKVGATP